MVRPHHDRTKRVQRQERDEREKISGERRELYPLDSARERFVCTKRPLNAVDAKRVARIALVVLLVWIQAVHVVKHVKVSSSIKPQVRVFPVALPCVLARRTHAPAMKEREMKRVKRLRVRGMSVGVCVRACVCVRVRVCVCVCVCVCVAGEGGAVL
jgi:hypothetical protein